VFKKEAEFYLKQDEVTSEIRREFTFSA